MFDTIVRDEWTADTERDAPATRMPTPVHAGAMVLPTERYGARRRISMPAAIVVGLIHVVLLGLIIQARTIYAHKQEASLAVVNLMPPPSPPPSSETPPPPAAPEIVAPKPIVQTPVPPVQTVAVAEEPSPKPMPTAAPAPPTPPALPPAPPSTVQSGDLATQMLAGKAPKYPVESRRNHEQGTVVLSLTLGIDGRVMLLAISRSSGFPRLDEAARSAVQGWRWAPTLHGGQAVQVRGLVEIPFVLKS